MPSQPTPPSSTSSNGASPDGQPFRVVRKRNRIPLSCAPCRHRKLKCNRAHPCDNCTKRGDMASCSYATPGSRRKAAATGPNSSPEDMQNRIDRLEGLVLSLMTSTNQQGGAAAAQAAINGSRSNSVSMGSDLRLDVEGSDMIEEEGENGEGDESEVEQVSRGIGIMKVDNEKAVFAGDSHWYAILGEISEVKKYFEAHKEESQQHFLKVQATRVGELRGTPFLFQGGQPSRDKAELLRLFPTKADADRLIARYFNAYDPSVHIIHGPTFQKQYDQHWLNPEATSMMWIGLCFSMMTLSLQSYHRAGDEPPEYRGRSQELSHRFRELTAQCLLLSDITQPIAQILETMILYLQAEYVRNKDAEPGVLLIMSLCVRLAMRMGYHRDSAPYPSITPFQGEMRRRVFSFVRQCDILFSFQFGLPAIIRRDQIDAQPPRNLYDDELYEDMTSLPPPGPNFVATPMSYMIAKSKMTFIFGDIVERVGSVTNPPSYEETMKFDQELREARTTHPPLLQMRPFQESARDPANLIMQRLGLEMMYLRSLFVLHRRFSVRGRDNARYAFSRKTCIDASMQLLSHQATLHRESQPGGRLRSVKWYISSLTTHDFLLAAMLVCLDLYHMAEAERKGRRSVSIPSPSSGADFNSEESRDEMLRTVEHCITIWDSVRNYSMEAYKASIALRVMVDKLKAAQALPSSQQSPDQASTNGASQASSTRGLSFAQRPNFVAFPNGNVNGVFTDDLPPEQSAAMTLGMLSSGGMSPGPGFGMNMNPTGSIGLSDKQTFPTGMTGLNNDPMTERTGLTPGYTGPDMSGTLPGLSGPASPFSSLFGQSGNMMGGLDGIGGDIDWGAWDNYIANNTALEPGSSAMWPMNLDFGPLDDPTANPPLSNTTSTTGTGTGTGTTPSSASGGVPPTNSSPAGAGAQGNLYPTTAAGNAF